MTAPAPNAGSRFGGRALSVARALALRRRERMAPRDPRRILVAHHLLLGDTLMLTPLLKKLRMLHPRADIAMTLPRAIAPLYATAPYGVRALPFDPRQSAAALYAEAPFDLALVPGDNRYAWLAAAMRARHGAWNELSSASTSGRSMNRMIGCAMTRPTAISEIRR